jgi:ABC-type transporter Mla subunit MlaD
MTGDEMERAIEFLLKNQADFDARFEAEREQTNQQIRALAEGQQRTQENLANLTEIVSQNSRDIARNSQQIGHLGEVLASVVEGQQSHKDDIDALIKLVGGLIEGREKGKPEG